MLSAGSVHNVPFSITGPPVRRVLRLGPPVPSRWGKGSLMKYSLGGQEGSCIPSQRTAQANRDFQRNIFAITFAPFSS